jgi:hypothetical protein
MFYRSRLMGAERLLFISLLFGLFCIVSVSVASAEVLYRLDFSGQPDGPANEWLKRQGFSWRLDADDLQPHFQNNRLVLQTTQKKRGLFELPLNLSNAKRLRVHWGVDRYPRGADWGRGVTAVPIAVMTSFGTKKISSGSLFVPNAPYFIGLFLGEKEQDNQVYTGNYYKKGGRYFCTPCAVPVGKVIVTEFDLGLAFRTQFGQAIVSPISRLGFQMNTKGTSGGAAAFLEKIEYLSD